MTDEETYPGGTKAKRKRVFTDGPEDYGACQHGAQICPICRGVMVGGDPSEKDVEAAQELIEVLGLTAWGTPLRVTLARFHADAYAAGLAAGRAEERERCALAAENFEDFTWAAPEGEFYSEIAGYATMRKLAAAIRRGEES